MFMLTISDAAEKLGVSVDTIRRWEKKGLIKSERSDHNYRVFSLDEIKRLHDKVSGISSAINNFRILKSKKPTKFTSIDLFAGAGGTALGLENAGLKHLFLNEFDKHAVATLRANRPGWNVSGEDVHRVDFTPWKDKVDVVEGGFPCQAFSYAGKGKGFDDTRGTLFHEFARAVKETNAKIAIGENVRGLLTHDGGCTLETMVGSLQQLGYRVAYKVMRSQYLDVPQKRERLVIIGVRNDIETPILFPRERDYTISLREAIGDKPQSDGQQYSESKFKVMKKVPEGGYWRDLSDKLQREYMKASYFHTGGKTGMARRLAWDEPSLTLTCNPAQKQTERCHPEETRPLNVREYARIQTFPDEWKFSGSTSSQYKQIGNAVPVNLGYYMGLAAINMLQGTESPDLEAVDDLPAINAKADVIEAGQPFEQPKLVPLFGS
ncbi:MAG TPA: DNA (cytosine-5-)-methyltransferase [Candidatus Saccharimonadales bacterium]|nr:DNA (cytosine-5-)-methyltransferase [Candidatus Saccharimonadales bacterium]